MRKLIIIFTLILFSQVIYAKDCSFAPTFKVLQQLESVGQLHNCEIEVVIKESSPEDDKPTMQVILYARDLYRCHKPNSSCPEVTFGAEISKSCLKHSVEKKSHAKWSSSYETKDSVFQSFISTRLDHFGRIIELEFGAMDLLNPKEQKRIQCLPEIYSGGWK